MARRSPCRAINLLSAEARLLIDASYVVTTVFNPLELYILRGTASIGLAILSNSIGCSVLPDVAVVVRRQWPHARILLVGQPAFTLEDYLYDEVIAQSREPEDLVDGIERLYKGLWNRASGILEWDARRYH